MFDSFDPNGTFFTDSNGLEMQERKLTNVTVDLYNEVREFKLGENDKGPSYQYISANYFPVDSAIAMRDKSGLSSI